MKKFLAGILCICLLVTMLPYTVLAEGTADSGDVKNATDEVIASDYSESSGINAQPGMYFPALGEDSAAEGIKDLQDGSWVKYDGITFSGSECAFSVDYATTGGSGSLKVYVDEIKEENLIVSASGLTGGSYGWCTVENHEVTLSKQVEAGEHSVIIEGGDVLTKADGSYQWDARTAGIRSFKFVEGEWVDPTPGETPGGDDTDTVLNGHKRMYAVDGVLNGELQSQTGGSILAPTFVNWFGEGDTVTYEQVNLNDASYVQYCALTNGADDVVINVYLDSMESDPIAVLEFAADKNWRERMVPLEESVTGEHDVIVAPVAGTPDFSWIQFLSEDEIVILNGHEKMQVIEDGVIIGDVWEHEAEGANFSYVSFFDTVGDDTLTYSNVDLTDAAYVKCYASTGHADGATFDVYLDTANSEPVATFEITATDEHGWQERIAALTGSISGMHDIIIKARINGPDLAWFQFLTLEEAGVLDGHQRLQMLDADYRNGGEFVFADNPLAPSHLGWINTGNYVKFNRVDIKNAKYVQLCCDAHVDGNQVDILIGSNETPVASFNFDTNKNKHVRTVELSEALTAGNSVTVKVAAGSPDLCWIRFLTEDEYNSIQLTSIALVGDSNVEYGQYFNGMCSVLDLEKYSVEAFGHAGMTAESYQWGTPYQNAMAAKADIYIITLGTNDAMYSESYISEKTEANYKQLINAIRAANPDAKIYAQTPLPLREADLANGTNNDPDGRTEAKITELIIPAIENACAELNVPIIDIYNGMLNSGFERTQYLSDHVHVNAAGGKLMAQLTCDAIFAEDFGEGTNPGNAEAVTIDAEKTELTQKGETVTLTANQEVYWKVVNADGTGSTTFATIDEDGVLTAVKPGAYQVVAVSKEDTTVQASKSFYNRFAYQVAEVDYIFGSNYSRRESFDARDGGVRLTELHDGLSLYLKDVDLTGVTSMTARAYSYSPNTTMDSTLELHLDAPDGPMIANSVITNTRLVSYDNTARYGDFKSGLVPVTDGELHDLYAVVNLPNREAFNYDLLSIDFGTGAENPVVVKDGTVVDIYSANFTCTAGEYTLYSQAESLPVMAFYDAEGRVAAAAPLMEDGDIRKASFTLTEDVPGASVRTYHWKDLASMEPVTPEYETYQEPITVACLGDSITKELNDDTDNDDLLSYPKFLQLTLGERYEVKNFGRGGTTIGGYSGTPAYARALEAACDIYVIQLGTNDARVGHDTNLEEGYQRVIDGVVAANPDAEIYICMPYPVFNNGNYGISENLLVNDVIPVVKKVAEDNNLPIINVHDQVLANPRVGEFDRGDNVHPKDVGMAHLAEIVKAGILGE